jgi:UDP-N-acetylglucosamine 3-dehydrogenase
MTSSREIRIGVIGLGQIALKAHLPGYEKADGCRITAIHSMREQHAKAVAVQYGIPYIYKDWKRLLESDHVDAVSVCTPNFTHVPIALKALHEGKHVLVEKPIAVNSKEGWGLVRAAKKYKKVLMVHHNMRFDPAVRTAEMLLRKNIVGEVFAFKSSLTHRGPQAWSPKANWFFNKEKSGGGALIDLGPHVLDSLSFLLGDYPIMAGAVAVDGKGLVLGEKMPPMQGEIHCSCLLKFKKGVVGSMTVGWADTIYQNRFYFFGTKGTLYVNLVKGEPIILEYRDKEGKIYPPLAKNSFSPSIYEHFIDCIKNGKTPWVSGEEGVKILELIEAGYNFILPKHVTSI